MYYIKLLHPLRKYLPGAAYKKSNSWKSILSETDFTRNRQSFHL